MTSCRVNREPRLTRAVPHHPLLVPHIGVASGHQLFQVIGYWLVRSERLFQGGSLGALSNSEISISRYCAAVRFTSKF